MSVEYKDRMDQINTAILWAIDHDEAHFKRLGNAPARLEYAARVLFLDGICRGYHCAVIRAAMRELQENGWIEATAKPYYINMGEE